MDAIVDENFQHRAVHKNMEFKRIARLCARCLKARRKQRIRKAEGLTAIHEDLRRRPIVSDRDLFCG